MKRLSVRQPKLRILSKRATAHKADVEKFIEDMRKHVKEDPIIIEKFKEYGVPLDDIDDVEVQFCDLDVSAKTKDRKIYLNEGMLAEDSEVKDPTHYFVHELVHYLQQTTGKNMQKHRAEDDYLEKGTEEEAFKAQVDYKKREESPEEAKQYVERLLDHHDYSGDKRDDKRDELLGE